MMMRVFPTSKHNQGGPAKMANNLPLRGAKFGVYVTPC